MRFSSSSDKVNNRMALLPAAVFLVVIWLPTLDSFFGLDKAPWLNEKRAPAAFPKVTLSVKGLRTLPAGLEAYYDDHFGFRRRLIRWEQKWKHELFREADRQEVMIGRDGWLYFTSEQMIEHFRGAKTFTQEELQNWQALLEKRRDWLAKRGIKYLFVIAPDKHSIYPEYLPGWMTKVGPETKLDQFFAHMRAHSTVEVLDLRPALREAKKTACTYLHTDTHWNSYGAFIGYQGLVRRLARQLPDVGEPLPYKAFAPTFSREKGGDLAVILGQDIPENDYVRMLPRPPLTLPEPKTDINISVRKWNQGTLPAYTENPSRKWRLLLFRDSFSVGWMNFLGYHFRRVVYLWQYNWDRQVIEREKPDVVVDEILERSFNTLDTKEMMKEDGVF